MTNCNAFLGEVKLAILNSQWLCDKLLKYSEELCVCVRARVSDLRKKKDHYRSVSL